MKIITNQYGLKVPLEYEGKGDKDKHLSPKEYLNMIRPYLSDMIIDYKTQGEWKIQLTMSINFIFSSKDCNETCNLHTKSNNIEIKIRVNETDEIIDELFESFFTKLSKRFRRINEKI